MTIKYALAAVGNLDGAMPPQEMDGRVVNAKLYCIQAVINLATDPITDQYVLAELPIGVLTALVGGPFFLWLLASRAAREGL